MSWNKLSTILREFYTKKDKLDFFEKDEEYLSNAYHEIEEIWTKNYNSIDVIRFVMISEAPLWGAKRKYIYNPETKHSQFFYMSDLEHLIDQNVINKIDFINKLNELGFIILDISPFALNTRDTVVNYRGISKRDYRNLLRKTLPIFFSKKLDLIEEKISDPAQFFYRYSRVKNAFNDLISKMIVERELVNTVDDIFDISQMGGGIDRNKLAQLTLHQSRD